MTETLVYCTSKAAAKLSLLDHLNDVCGFAEFELPPLPDRPPPPPRYISARERKMIIEEDEYSREEPDLFENWTNEQCAQFYTEHHEPERFIDKTMFITLDERSAKDKTLVLHHRRYDDKKWESWRIQFKDAFFMLVGMHEDAYQTTFVHADRFLDENGIFHPKEAEDTTQREWLKAERGGAHM